MTRLQPAKPVRRETAVRYRGDLLVVELYPLYIRVRTKGARNGYDVPYAAVYECGGRIAARSRMVGQ